MASTLGYLKRLLGPLGKGREGIYSTLEGNSKRIRLGLLVDSLALYILSYGVYMFVSDLPILFRAGIVEINNMMQSQGSGRMEEKHRTCVVCMCVAT